MRLDEDGPVSAPAFSPDGRRIAVTLLKEGTYEIGVFDLERGLMTQLTAGGDNLNPSWIPQGNRVTFFSNSSGSYNFYTARADGSDAPQPLLSSPPGGVNSAAAWTPDGKNLAYARLGEPNFEIWLLSTEEGASPTPLLTGTGNVTRPAFSPDGRLLAHESDESGSWEIYVRPFPNVGDARWQISTGGGNNPEWRFDGRELLYITDRGIMSATIVEDAKASGNLSTRSELLIEMQGITGFDLAPDGKTLAISRRPIEDIASEIHVVLNWFEELERLVPTD